jgi:hypothetical protein
MKRRVSTILKKRFVCARTGSRRWRTSARHFDEKRQPSARPDSRHRPSNSARRPKTQPQLLAIRRASLRRPLLVIERPRTFVYERNRRIHPTTTPTTISHETAPPATPDGEPKPNAQRNFTDPQSRIMFRDGTFLQAYNAQIAVDEGNQIIVAAALSNQGPDTEYFEPILRRVVENCDAVPNRITADAGYFSPANILFAESLGAEPFVAVGGHRRDGLPDEQSLPISARSESARTMKALLNSDDGHAAYARRKATVEPVFGQIRACRGFRQMSFRGLVKTDASGCWSAQLTISSSCGERPERPVHYGWRRRRNSAGRSKDRHGRPPRAQPNPLQAPRSSPAARSRDTRCRRCGRGRAGHRRA